MPPRRPTIPILSIPQARSVSQTSSQSKSPPPAASSTDVRKSSSSQSAGARAAEEDYTRLAPDEMFVRYTVAEVKSIRQRLKAEADAKQEQLRLMVGDSYRDLLQASTSIISISQSSRRVVDALSEITSACTSEDPSATQNWSSITSTSKRKSSKDDQQLLVLQSLSAHLKLLLDAPEQIWRLLEKQKYLHAAWLFLLSRVVYRALMREEEGGDVFGDAEAEGEISWEREGIQISEQFPLIQRQWDTLSQFRAQIAHRATQSLREFKSSTSDIAQTLLSILLLDSIPLSETLSLLLSQRSKSLQTLHTKVSIPTPSFRPDSPTPPSYSRPSSPFSPSRKKNRQVAAALLAPAPSSEVITNGTALKREKSKNRKEVVRDVKNASKQVLQLVGSTLRIARDLFGATSKTVNGDSEEGPSLIEELLDGIQIDPPLPTASNHNRRASILFSQPLAPAESQSEPTTSNILLSTPQVLNALPSSQLLIRFLPSSIKTYVPYIDTTSPSSRLTRDAAQRTTEDWFRNVLEGLEEKLTEWMECLEKVEEVWGLRDVLKGGEMGFSKVQSDMVERTIENISSKRVQEIWRMGLRDVVRGFRKALDRSIAIVKEGKEESMGDTNPPSFLFSSSLPSLSGGLEFTFRPSGTPALSTAGFDTFKVALRQRVSLRPPLLDSVLSELEQGVKEVNGDLQAVFDYRGVGEEMEKRYTPAAQECAVKIVKELENRLEAELSGEEADDGPIRAMIFLGNVALKLSSSPFLQALGCTAVSAENFRADLSQLHMRFLVAWVSRANRRARMLYQNGINSTSALPTSQSLTKDLLRVQPPPSRPSNALAQALFSLGTSVDSLGLSHEDLKETQAPRKLVLAFAFSVLEKLHELEIKDWEQMFWDVSLLRTLCEAVWKNSADEPMEKLRSRFQEPMAKITAQITSSSPKEAARFIADTQSSITEYLNRTQLVLGSLLWAQPSGGRNALLPFGTPAEQHGQQLPLAKPGQRFSQILVGSSGVR